MSLGDPDRHTELRFHPDQFNKTLPNPMILTNINFEKHNCPPKKKRKEKLKTIELAFE
jgi:hypothetical protein